MYFKSTLYIPTFWQFFSLQAAAKIDARINFDRENSKLIYPNVALFNIKKRERLNYLKNILSAKNANYD